MAGADSGGQRSTARQERSDVREGIHAGLRTLFWIYFTTLGLYTALMITNGAWTYIQSGLMAILWIGALFWWLMYLGRQPESSRSRRIYAFIPPLLVIVLIALSWTDLPLRVRFNSSKADLAALAQDALEGDEVIAPQTAGLYTVRDVSIGFREIPVGGDMPEPPGALGTGVKLEVGSAGLWGASQWGFFYSDVPPQNYLSPTIRFQHLTGPWYVYKLIQGS